MTKPTSLYMTLLAETMVKKCPSKGGDGRRGKRDISSGSRSSTAAASGASTSSGRFNYKKASPCTSSSTKGGSKSCPICWKDSHHSNNCLNKTCLKCRGKGHSPSVCATGVATFCEDDGDSDSDFGVLVVDQLDVEDSALVALRGESGLIFPLNKDDTTQFTEIWYGDNDASRHVKNSKDV